MFRRLRCVFNRNFNRDVNDKCIQRNQVLEYLKNGAILIDVRSPQEFKEGRIDGAINIPDYDIGRRIQKEVMNKNDLIVLYCSTGYRSKKVQEMLMKMGYSNVYNVCNGMR